METNYDDYYKKQLEESKEFQDFVCEKLIKMLGVSVTNFGSKKYQFNVGENIQGLEIKYDKKFKETNNLYIEVAEKSHPNNKNYVDSGIYRSDNSWLYVIGDYNIIYIFSKRNLQHIDSSINKRIKTPTSIGFLVSKEEAENIYIKKIIL